MAGNRQSFHPSCIIQKAGVEGGFTLIELSIVLIIIGLIVGGILVGQNLIAAGYVRATVTQIEKFNQATNTFYGKYGVLPGDMNNQTATQFGFAARGTSPGQGDGNGIIEGTSYGYGSNAGYREGGGETAMFWVELTTANGLKVNLIDGSFSAATPNGVSGLLTGSALNTFFPAAKMGQNNYIYVYSNQTKNFFGLSAVTSINNTMASNLGLTVAQAAAIDAKMDDGLPQSGNAQALYLNYTGGYVSPIWAGTQISSSPYTTATAPSSTSCFDNGNVSGAIQQYSVGQNGGNYMNCALSFRFQ